MIWSRVRMLRSLDWIMAAGFFRAGIKRGMVMEGSGFGKKNGVRLPAQIK
jgi:hypothetical protein